MPSMPTSSKSTQGRVESQGPISHNRSAQVVRFDMTSALSSLRGPHAGPALPIRASRACACSSQEVHHITPHHRRYITSHHTTGGTSHHRRHITSHHTTSQEAHPRGWASITSWGPLQGPPSLACSHAPVQPAATAAHSSPHARSHATLCGCTCGHGSCVWPCLISARGHGLPGLHGSQRAA